MTFTPPSDDELRALGARIDDAATNAKDVYEITTRMDVTAEERDTFVGIANMAFQYGADRDSRGLSSYFTEMFGYPDGSQYPPVLTDIPDIVWDLWGQLAEIVAEPLAQARLHDLCFCGRKGNIGDHARRAASGYLRAAARLGTSFDEQGGAVTALRQGDYLRRAKELGRLTGQHDVSNDAETAYLAAIKATNEAEPFDVSRAIVITQAAVDENFADSAIDDLLDRLATETRDVFFTERVIRLQLRRASDDERPLLHRKLVEAWINEADRSDPSRVVWNLTTAGELARDFGIADLQATITTRLQGTELEDHGLVRRRVTVPVDPAQAEAFVQRFMDLPSWQDALLALLAENPPTGDIAMNRRAAEAMLTEAPLFSSIPHVLLGGDGLPRVTISTDEEKREWRLTHCETFHLQVLGSYTDEILRRIGVKWAPIPEDQLTEFLSAEPHTSTEVCATLARAFNHFFNGDFEAAAYIAAPQIERIVREAVLAVDAPAYRLQRGSTPGQYAGLGALLPVLLNKGVNESWIRFIQTALCAPIGMNYRNELLHGFVDEVHSGNAALILLAGLYLSRGISLTTLGATTADGDE